VSKTDKGNITLRDSKWDGLSTEESLCGLQSGGFGL